MAASRIGVRRMKRRPSSACDTDGRSPDGGSDAGSRTASSATMAAPSTTAAAAKGNQTART